MKTENRPIDRNDLAAAHLGYIFKFLDEALKENDRKSTSNSPAKLKPSIFGQKYTIPTWALVAFVVACGLSLFCLMIGHWVNTGVAKQRLIS